MKWEEWEIERAVDLWKKGSTSGQIGEVIGRTGASVRAFVKNNREKYGLTPRMDDTTEKPHYDPEYYYLPKYHWLISKSWSDT
jgi:hypothetical protein